MRLWMQDFCNVLKLAVQQTIILLMVFAVCSNGSSYCRCCKAFVVFYAQKEQYTIQQALINGTILRVIANYAQPCWNGTNTF